MKDDHTFNWFRLAEIKGVGTKFLWQIYNFLVQESLTLDNLINTNYSSIPSKFKNKLDLLSEQDYDRVYSLYQNLLDNRVKLLTADIPKYPQKIIPFASEYNIPPLLYTRGNISLSNTESISIVGSRHIGEDAMSITQNLAQQLAFEGFNIVSGYAKGIDTSAHLGALQAEGTTTMVLVEGILNFSAKKEFKPLFSSSNTLVISQFYPQEKWLARNAMARNKLVCALSSALIVISSGKELDSKGRRSGTFDAAKTAMTMNIPVFVFSPDSFIEMPEGNRDLIELGGHKITQDNAVNLIVSTLTNNCVSPVKEKEQTLKQIELFSAIS